jgi:hypothetical protein
MPLVKQVCVKVLLRTPEIDPKLFVLNIRTQPNLPKEVGLGAALNPSLGEGP